MGSAASHDSPPPKRKGHGAGKPATGGGCLPESIDKLPPKLPNKEEARTEEEKEVLHVQELDYNIDENTEAHHTDGFEITRKKFASTTGTKRQLIVRRGQPINISITFDRPFDKQRDDIKLIFSLFSTRAKPATSKGTLVRLTLSDEDKPKQWGAKILKQEKDKLTVTVFLNPTCPIGIWNFRFDTIYKKGDVRKVFQYTHDEPIFIFFNAWCEDDAVFLKDEAERQEYVLSDTGIVYKGSSRRPRPTIWNFGQFEDFMPGCCLSLLDVANLKNSPRNNPVHVCRAIANVTNSMDNTGVLVGNWSGDYSGGTSPLQWNGSVGIMQEYFQSRLPVKYGQCWVFSGVVVTICRTLGIPCRSITNYSSSHDTDGSLTIDCYWDPDGKCLGGADSVWNFHVWNEVWMTRPDLSAGYGGWQVMDATPQEESLIEENVRAYTCGPMSKTALKAGEVALPYDGEFIFAEFNADKVHWKIQEDGSYKNRIQKNCVGKSISTKKVGSDERQDVTDEYKYQEGSSEERVAVLKALENSTRSELKDVYKQNTGDIKCDMVEKENSAFGEDFNVTLKITNTSKEDTLCKVNLAADPVSNSGIIDDNNEIKRLKKDVTVAAGKEISVKMDVELKDYIDKMNDECLIRMTFMVYMPKTEQYYCEFDDFALIKPDITIQCSTEQKEDKEFEVELSFTNPLDKELTKCLFTIEAPRMQRPKKIPIANVAKGGIGKDTAKLMGPEKGTYKIIAGFECEQIEDVIGNITVKIV